MDRIKREMESLRAQLRNARSDAEEAIDGAVERILQAIEGKKHTSRNEHPERVLDDPRPEPKSVVVIRHDRHAAK